MQSTRILAVAALALTVVHAQSAGAVASGDELTVFTNEHRSAVPGYPLGDVAIGNPKIADFKVMPGRREVLVFGKGMDDVRDGSLGARAKKPGVDVSDDGHPALSRCAFRDAGRRGAVARTYDSAWLWRNC